ncbi:MAG: hypothetical protein RIR17_2197 [Planctomycetota bacterium]
MLGRLRPLADPMLDSGRFQGNSGLFILHRRIIGAKNFKNIAVSSPSFVNRHDTVKMPSMTTKLLHTDTNSHGIILSIKQKTNTLALKAPILGDKQGSAFFLLSFLGPFLRGFSMSCVTFCLDFRPRKEGSHLAHASDHFQTIPNAHLGHRTHQVAHLLKMI